MISMPYTKKNRINTRQETSEDVFVIYADVTMTGGSANASTKVNKIVMDYNMISETQLPEENSKTNPFPSELLDFLASKRVIICPVKTGSEDPNHNTNEENGIDDQFLVNGVRSVIAYSSPNIVSQDGIRIVNIYYCDNLVQYGTVTPTISKSTIYISAD